MSNELGKIFDSIEKRKSAIVRITLDLSIDQAKEILDFVKKVLKADNS